MKAISDEQMDSFHSNPKKKWNSLSFNDELNPKDIYQ